MKLKGINRIQQLQNFNLIILVCFFKCWNRFRVIISNHLSSLQQSDKYRELFSKSWKFSIHQNVNTEMNIQITSIIRMWMKHFPFHIFGLMSNCRKCGSVCRQYVWIFSLYFVNYSIVNTNSEQKFSVNLNDLGIYFKEKQLI